MARNRFFGQFRALTSRTTRVFDRKRNDPLYSVFNQAREQFTPDIYQYSSQTYIAEVIESLPRGLPPVGSPRYEAIADRITTDANGNRQLSQGQSFPRCRVRILEAGDAVVPDPLDGEPTSTVTRALSSLHPIAIGFDPGLPEPQQGDIIEVEVDSLLDPTDVVFKSVLRSSQIPGFSVFNQLYADLYEQNSNTNAAGGSLILDPAGNSNVSLAELQGVPSGDVGLIPISQNGLSVKRGFWYDKTLSYLLDESTREQRINDLKEAGISFFSLRMNRLPRPYRDSESTQATIRYDLDELDEFMELMESVDIEIDFEFWMIPSLSWINSFFNPANPTSLPALATRYPNVNIFDFDAEEYIAGVEGAYGYENKLQYMNDFLNRFETFKNTFRITGRDVKLSACTYASLVVIPEDGSTGEGLLPRYQAMLQLIRNADIVTIQSYSRNIYEREVYLPGNMQIRDYNKIIGQLKAGAIYEPGLANYRQDWNSPGDDPPVQSQVLQEYPALGEPQNSMTLAYNACVDEIGVRRIRWWSYKWFDRYSWSPEWFKRRE